MSRHIQFSTAFTADHIDVVNAVIRGVSVITSGLIARGHDLEVDGVTLTQMKGCADEKGQVPVKVDHKSGAAAVCGFLTKFRIEQKKLKADWHLLQSHPQKDQILEVAQRMPRGVGLSASFVSPERGEHGKARCDELISVDYVTLPAANPDGMFSRRDNDHPLTALDKVKRALAAAGRGAGTGAAGGVCSRAYLLRRRPDLAHVANHLPASAALAGGLIAGAVQIRRDRDLAARVAETFFSRERATITRIRESVGRNVRLPIPGVDEIETARAVARKPLVRRIAVKALKVGAGATLGYYAGRKIGARAGALTGAVAGALFSSDQVRNSVQLSILSANKITNL